MLTSVDDSQSQNIEAFDMTSKLLLLQALLRILAEFLTVLMNILYI